MRHRRALLVLVAIVIGVVGAPVSARAHPLSTTATASVQPLLLPELAASTWTSARPITGGGPLLALASAALAVALIPGHRRTRHLRPTALALLVLVAGFTGATHSVHHMGDPTGADRCLVAASAEHLSGVGGASAPVTGCIAATPEPSPGVPPAAAHGVASTPVTWRGPPA